MTHNARDSYFTTPHHELIHVVLKTVGLYSILLIGGSRILRLKHRKSIGCYKTDNVNIVLSCFRISLSKTSLLQILQLAGTVT